MQKKSKKIKPYYTKKWVFWEILKMPTSNITQNITGKALPLPLRAGHWAFLSERRREKGSGEFKHPFSDPEKSAGIR